MANVFSPDAFPEPAVVRAEYLAYLKGRDGAPDRAARRLAVREAWFAAIDANPLRWEGPDMEAAFHAAMRPASVQGQPPLALWMAIAATANEGEKYSVERILASREPVADPEDPMSYVEIEEIYHTRLLLDAIRTVGVAYEVKTPPLWVRALASFMIFAPKSLEYMAVFVSEVIGTVLFAALAERARTLVDPATPAGARLVALIEEILVDEIGHVVFARSHLGRVRLWLAEQTVRFLAAPMYRATAATTVLFDVEELAARARTLDLSTLPRHVLARAFVPEPAPSARLAPL
jgi:hypothetical protein